MYIDNILMIIFSTAAFHKGIVYFISFVHLLMYLFLRVQEKNRAPYKAYCPPYILSRSREKLRSIGENSDCGGFSLGSSILSTDQQCSILYVAYCLSEDQKWILVSAIDEQGLILETSTINIHIPNRYVRRPATRLEC